MTKKIWQYKFLTIPAENGKSVDRRYVRVRTMDNKSFQVIEERYVCGSLYMTTLDDFSKQVIDASMGLEDSTLETRLSGGDDCCAPDVSIYVEGWRAELSQHEQDVIPGLFNA